MVVTEREARARSPQDVRSARRSAADSVGLEQIVADHADVVWRYAMGMLRDAADAEDVTQETFLRVHRNMDGFRGDAAMRTWIVSICRNLCLDLLRRRREVVPLDRLAESELSQAAGEDHASMIAIQQDLAAGMAALPDPEREAVLMIDVLGFDGEQAARICSVRPTTLRSRRQRGHARLVEHLQGGQR